GGSAPYSSPRRRRPPARRGRSVDRVWAPTGRWERGGRGQPAGRATDSPFALSGKRVSFRRGEWRRLRPKSRARLTAAVNCKSFLALDKLPLSRARKRGQRSVPTGSEPWCSRLSSTPRARRWPPGRASTLTPPGRRPPAYRSDWAKFTAWAESRGLATMPAAPATVALDLTDLAEVAKTST